MRKSIAIIGGMGPQASLRFHQLLIEKSTQYHGGNGDGYPFIVHFSLPIADFISDESQKAAATAMIQAQAPILERLQPSTITLACNTAHLLVSQTPCLQVSQFLSMIDVVAHRLESDGVQRVGLLATPTTIRSKLYENALQERNISVLRPTEAQQKQLEAAIRAVIADDPAKHHRDNVQAVAKSLAARGADAVLLGCTELPLLFASARSTIPTYDCLDIYADAVIARHYLYNGA